MLPHLLCLRYLVSVTCVLTTFVIAYFITSQNARVVPTKKVHQNNFAVTPVPTDDPLATYDGNYIITQTFGGQMTRAIRNMMLQQCWGTNLGHNYTYIVEPFSAASNLFHSARFWTDLEKGKLRDATRFSEYYDLKYYNLKSQMDNSIGLATWEKFLKYAPRHSVVVVAPQQSCRFPSNTRDSINTKISSTCSFTKNFQDFVTGLEKYNFYVTKVTCVHCSSLRSPLTLKELHTELYAGHNFSKVTVMINSWRNFAHTSTWLQVSEICKLSEDPASSTRLRPSQQIINHTQYYMKNIIRSQGVVAVMIRIERFLTQQVSGRIQRNLTSCLNATVVIHDKIKKKVKDTGTLLTLDVGRFGSQVMQNSNAVSKLAVHGEESIQSITFLAENTMKRIYNGKFTIKTWEDTFSEASGGITEVGYIAMLQRNIATVADCLILMGGGSYQQVAAHQYINNHPNPSRQCLHTICVTKSFDKSFREYYV